jgi:hypothetical protein
MARRSDLNKSLNQFFTNRFVLYFFTILAFVHVVGYIAAAQYDALIFFVVVGLLSTNFTKNLSLVFLSAIVLTNLIYFRGMSRYMNSLEGFEGKSGKSKKSKESMTNNKRKQTDNDEDDDDKDADTDRLDKKEQLKNQYKRLEGLMNSDGLKKMTHDSKELMESQSKLMENMKSMEPMINSVQGMVDKFGGMDKLLGMADKLSSGSSQLKGAAFK